MYSVYDYGSMIQDRIRMDAYVSALRQAIEPGCAVLDIGTGTGIFALLACQFGAAHVYAIESNDAIHVARDIAAANGYRDRITFYQGMSTDIDLPEKVDVIISDMRGSLPLSEQHIPSIVDARRRFLAPGGTLIPLRDQLFAALVEAPQYYQDLTAPWDAKTYGLNMEAARRIVTNCWTRSRRNHNQILKTLVEPACWAVVEYRTIESPHISGRLEVQVTQEGTAHGFMIWFDATLAEGIAFSNAPDKPELIYGSPFVPLTHPVPVVPGDIVSLTLQAHLIDEDYMWRWDTRVVSSGNGNRVKARFTQSTFDGMPLSLEKLRKRAAQHMPRRNATGELDRYVLGLMDGTQSLETIAARVIEQFPERFASLPEALAAVSKLSLRYSQS